MAKSMAKRYLVLVVGLFCCGFGVALVTKASLGTSPVAAIPYTLSLMYPVLTLGNWTILYSLLLIVLELVLLKGKCPLSDLAIQLMLIFAFGYIVDFGMFLLQGFTPDTYLVKMLALLIGCTILSFGAYLEIVADVGMLAIDAFEYTLAKVTHREYSTVRPIADMAMVIVAGIMCVVFLHALVGVREGTIITALIAGQIVKFCQVHLRPFENAVRAA